MPYILQYYQKMLADIDDELGDTQKMKMWNRQWVRDTLVVQLSKVIEYIFFFDPIFQPVNIFDTNSNKDF